MGISGERHETVYRSRHARRRRSGTLPTLVLAVTAVLGIVAGLQAVASGSADSDSSTGSPSAKPVLGSPPVDPTATEPGQKQPAAPAWTPKSSADVPPGAAIPIAGGGSYRVVPGTSPVVGTGPRRTYTVEIESGVKAPDGDAAFGAAVQATLSDPRSWIGGGEVAWKRVDSGRPRLRIRLVSELTARARCGYDIPVDVSCYQSGTVYLSAVRWIRGAVAYHGDLASYRLYMVNHEVGHSLGRGHEPCGANGGPAPVMMQQTFSTSDDEINDIIAGHPQGAHIPRDHKVCRPNPWPHP